MITPAQRFADALKVGQDVVVKGEAMKVSGFKPTEKGTFVEVTRPDGRMIRVRPAAVLLVTN